MKTTIDDCWDYLARPMYQDYRADDIARLRFSNTIADVIFWMIWDE